MYIRHGKGIFLAFFSVSDIRFFLVRLGVIFWYNRIADNCKKNRKSHKALQISLN